jgi:hypothetical protein
MYPAKEQQIKVACVRAWEVRLVHRHVGCRQPHVQLAHVQLAHVRLAHVQLAHVRLAHVWLAHVQLAHVQLADTEVCSPVVVHAEAVAE